eukprot:scaffold290383_cov19-Tisochrysis_lutea.AAC.1
MRDFHQALFKALDALVCAAYAKLLTQIGCSDERHPGCQPAKGHSSSKHLRQSRMTTCLTGSQSEGQVTVRCPKPPCCAGKFVTQRWPTFKDKGASSPLRTLPRVPVKQ